MSDDSEKYDNCEDMQYKISELFEQYKENKEVIQKMNNYINTLLPRYLEKYCKNHKNNSNDQIKQKCNVFIEDFINKNQYYYISNAEFFISYDGHNYKIVNEDIIQYEVLSKITNEKTLIEWKQKIKETIIEKIKKNNIMDAVPESFTIQNIISRFTPIIFESKNHAKFFLTVIGDILLKKNTKYDKNTFEDLYLIDSYAKSFVKELSHHIHNFFPYALTINDIITVNLDDELSKYFLLKINKNVEIKELWNKLFVPHIIDLIVVSCHYSHRFKSATNFLTDHCRNMNLVEHSLFLRNNSKDSIYNKFIMNFEISKDFTYSMIEFSFFWKLFLKDNNLPCDLFKDVFENDMISEKYIYENCIDKSKGKLEINLKNLNFSDNYTFFCNFWDENVTYKVGDDNEYEIGELCDLYYENIENMQASKKYRISEEDMLDIIRHFYPSTQIENNKTILNITCKTWDKSISIIDSIQKLKIKLFSECETNPITFYSAYKFYCQNYSSNNKYKKIVNKRFFDKYLVKYIPYIHIENDNIILPSYWEQ